MTRHQDDPPHVLFTCDVCSGTAQGDYPEAPPKGWVTLLVRPAHGPGLEAHLHLDVCLTVGADNIAEGRLPDGTITAQPKETP